MEPLIKRCVDCGRIVCMCINCIARRACNDAECKHKHLVEVESETKKES